MTDRQLLLLRHAKSSWRDRSLDDHDRPLNARGTAAALRMGRYLAESGLWPDRVLCSTAKRTRRTWELVAEARDGADTSVSFFEALYHAYPAELMATIREAGGDARRLLVIGHNPGMEAFAAQLAEGDAEETAIASMHAKFPTAALAVFDCRIADWRELSREAARLEGFVTPASLEAN